MNVDKLLKALDNENNEELLNFTTKKIREMNYKVLNELMLSKEQLKYYSNKLKYYKYVDEINQLRYGSHIRWFSLIDPNDIKLNNCVIFCSIKITDAGISLVYKTFGFKSKYYQIKLDEHLVFQKLNEQEIVLLNALDHLSK